MRLLVFVLALTACHSNWKNWPPDADGDGWAQGLDCNDEDASIHPGADETCNAVDDDCNGQIDENPVDGTTYYVDLDGDGYGGTRTVLACTQPEGATADSTDCDDTDVAVHPDAGEVCDGRDDNCDGEVDVGARDAPTWYADADLDGYGDPDTTTVACAAPTAYLAEATDCNDDANGIHPGATEMCDGYDDDCNGVVDDGAADANTYYRDLDGDGAAGDMLVITSCSQPANTDTTATDCDDTDATVHPGATEVCDGRDDDCNDAVDDNAVDALTWYGDTDHDGYGDPNAATEACGRPADAVLNGFDCAPDDDAVHPGQPEQCDGKDDDCNGHVDDNAVNATLYYRDLDGDGDAGDVLTVRACSQPAHTGTSAGDCDDLDARVYPGATEHCDGKDDNCNGTPDDGAVQAKTWYADTDADGFGDPADHVTTCTAPDGYVADFHDCAPSDAAIYPGHPEHCDGKDDDCDGVADDHPTDGTLFYADLDGDGYAGDTVTTSACAAPKGYLATAEDCDDGRPEVHPGAPEVCDGRDDNCNSSVDEDDGALGTGQACAAESCLAIRDANITSPAPNDVYWLDPAPGGDPFRAYCVMDVAGGGWTMIGSFVHGDELYHWTRYGDNTNIWPNNLGTWRNQDTFGSLGTYEAADYKSPAYWRVSGADLLALDDAGGWAAYQDALSGSMLDTVTTWAGCTTQPMTGVTVTSSDPTVASQGTITFYGGDPNESSHCALNYGANLTDSAVVSLGGGCCSSDGFGYLGFLNGNGAHTDKDFNFCLQDPANATTWYGYPSVQFAGGCQYAMLLVR